MRKLTTLREIRASFWAKVDIYGERAGLAVLTSARVSRMRQLRCRFGVRVVWLARLFGVSRSTVNYVLSYQLWNRQDRELKKRLKDIHNVPEHKGSSNANSILTEAAVRAMRTRYAHKLKDPITQSQLASIYGVKAVTVQKILSRKLWKHV
jgi:DNA-binding transcriptional regulator YiaG